MLFITSDAELELADSGRRRSCLKTETPNWSLWVFVGIDQAETPNWILRLLVGIAHFKYSNALWSRLVDFCRCRTVESSNAELALAGGF